MALRDEINALARTLPPWPLYLLAVLPPAWLLHAGLTGGLGVEPIEAMEHQMGRWGLQMLIASLCVTPLRRHASINLLKFRRAIGLIAFFYILLHLLVWLLLDIRIPSQIWADILKRPYITVGMTGFVLLIPLALTSSNLAIRRLGPGMWRRIHWLVYPALALGALHFVMLTKGWQLEPLIYAGIVACLLILRLPVPRLARPVRG